MESRIPEVNIEGASRERGRALGRALRGQIGLFLDELRPRAGIDSGAPISAAVAALLRQSARTVREFLPEIALEVDGLAEGAEIPSDDAWLLQLWREAQAVIDPRSAAECSLFTGAWRGHPVLAQTVDLQGHMARHAVVLRIEPESGPAILMFTFAGLLGYLGINSAGITVGINMLVSDGWLPGVPPYLLVRHILTQSTLEDAQRELQRIPRASSRCLTIADGRRAIQIEMTPEALRAMPGEHLLHTNHYMHPDLISADRSHVLLRRSSKARLGVLSTLVQGHYSGNHHASPVTSEEEAEKILAILSYHGDPASLCCHGRAGGRSYQTVAAVAMFPSEGELFLRPGNPCTSETHLYRLAGVAHV
jgi:hypothetical protein